MPQRHLHNHNANGKTGKSKSFFFFSFKEGDEEEEQDYQEDKNIIMCSFYIFRDWMSHLNLSFQFQSQCCQ